LDHKEKVSGGCQIESPVREVFEITCPMLLDILKDYEYIEKHASEPPCEEQPVSSITWDPAIKKYLFFLFYGEILRERRV
jgi:hypothetical protein